MRRYIAITALLLTAFFVGMCVRTYGFPGQSLNGGVTVHAPWSQTYYGVEVWGNPGFFSEDCSGGC